MTPVRDPTVLGRHASGFVQVTSFQIT